MTHEGACTGVDDTQVLFWSIRLSALAYDCAVIVVHMDGTRTRYEG